MLFKAITGKAALMQSLEDEIIPLKSTMYPTMKTVGLKRFKTDVYSSGYEHGRTGKTRTV